jgi:hypothetical protein
MRNGILITKSNTGYKYDTPSRLSVDQRPEIGNV